MKDILPFLFSMMLWLQLPGYWSRRGSNYLDTGLEELDTHILMLISYCIMYDLLPHAQWLIKTHGLL